MYKILRKFTGSRERVKNKESGGNYSQTIVTEKSHKKNVFGRRNFTLFTVLSVKDYFYEKEF
jgi:hypothetical protein